MHANRRPPDGLPFTPEHMERYVRRAHRDRSEAVAGAVVKVITLMSEVAVWMFCRPSRVTHSATLAVRRLAGHRERHS